MSRFDDIPEDQRPSYPCPECGEGSVTQAAKYRWECDSCEFFALAPTENKEGM